MNYTARFFAQFCISLTATLGISACTTVDLSQVTTQTVQVPVKTASTNVVERAAKQLSKAFAENGWSKTRSKIKAQTAASILLNGMQKHAQASAQNEPVVRKTFSISDITKATSYVVRTTKAADVYLNVSDLNVDVAHELSLLETALISAKQAEQNFLSGDQTEISNRPPVVMEAYRSAVENLKSITDHYGARARQAIFNTTRTETN
ncbi:MAG TPA: hypothetical protein ENJ42_07585 [Hellea balneolensis]|uniref:Lipoprotein n=1 Tax=Hellea balneolensis TaxID=287478 RepID=A0A7C5QQ39_9PROT|nr:hypothetical protein [Hellea balneolensis]